MVILSVPERAVKVVAKGAHKGVKGRPKGVKGRYVIVDARMKKEARVVDFLCAHLIFTCITGSCSEKKRQGDKERPSVAISPVYFSQGVWVQNVAEHDAFELMFIFV